MTVFEALPVLGGMLRVGIPDYRLPGKSWNLTFRPLPGRGLPLKPIPVIGKDLSLDDLKEEGYQAFFLATGAHQEVHLGIQGKI